MTTNKIRPRVVTWDHLHNDAGDFPDSDPAFFNYHILAEGDSWFTLGGIPTSNLLFELRFSAQTMIVNLARPGDTIVRITDIAENIELREALNAPALKWRAILLSGGGNDLVDEASNILLSRSERSAERMARMEDYCDQTKLVKLLETITEGFSKIVALRDQLAGKTKRVPIVTHTYDYMTPRNSPTRFFGVPTLGPWIYKAFRDNDIPGEDWLELSEYLVNQMAESHLEMVKKFNDFHVVDTRGMLIPASLGSTGDDGDWLNEIHPNNEGYKKLANTIEKTLLPFMLVKKFRS